MSEVKDMFIPPIWEIIKDYRNPYRELHKLKFNTSVDRINYFHHAYEYGSDYDSDCESDDDEYYCNLVKRKWQCDEIMVPERPIKHWDLTAKRFYKCLDYDKNKCNIIFYLPKIGHTRCGDCWHKKKWQIL